MRLPRFNRLTGLRWWSYPAAYPPSDPGTTDAKITELLRSQNPCAIGKLGTTELMGLEYLYRAIRLPWPPSASWRRPARRLHDCSGLFPIRRDMFDAWAGECRAALGRMDVLCQWQTSLTYLASVEDRILALLAPQAFRAHRQFIHLLRPLSGWLEALAGLRWLVIHPFEKTIRSQLPRLGTLGIFPPQTLPALEARRLDTRILPCPQFSFMVPPRHPDWKTALDELRASMEKETFDIALIGAGAWSLPLAAHAKTIGRKAIHLGGTLQLLFGIRGNRFDSMNFTTREGWIRPLPEDTPPNHHRMEQGAYW